MNTPQSLQFDREGRLRHLLTTEGMSREHLHQFMDTAESFISVTQREVKKVPLLRGRTVVNLFFEASTRTRTTFELAAKRLSADVLNLNVSASATVKGESLLDTLCTLEAMQVDMFVVRHPLSGAAHFVAEHCQPHVAVLNAGDGRHAHPTQALLDVFTIRRVSQDFESMSVAIVGDILHSRVARSQIHALTALGVPDIRVVAPKTLLPVDVEALGARVFTDLDNGMRGVDVVIMLRLQKERMQGALLPSEHEYFREFGVTAERLRQVSPDVLILHPGPINRGVELESAVADGPRSMILEQVSNGIAIRMAAMSMVMSSRSPSNPGSEG